MNVGGPATLLAELDTVLVNPEFKHTLITGHCLPNESDFLINHELLARVIFLRGKGRGFSPISGFIDLIYLIKIIRKLKPDVIHTHTSKGGVLGRLASIFLTKRIPIVHTFHGHLLYGYFSKYKLGLIIISEKLLARLTSLLVAVSEQVKIDLLSTGIGIKNRWQVIHPGVYPAKQTFETNDLNEQSQIEDSFIVCWIGRFTDIKNPTLAIQSFSKFSRMFGKSSQLIMAGDGEQLKECKKLASELDVNVNFLGWVENIDELLNVSSLLLMTSKNEGLPVVIVEAGIRSVPTLSTNVGGVKDFISDGKTGYLVEQEIDIIADKLLIIAKNRSDRLNVGKTAKAFSESDFSLNLFLQKHIAIYRELAARK